MSLTDSTEYSPFCAGPTEKYDLPFTLPIFRLRNVSEVLPGNAEYDVIDITNGQFERDVTLADTALKTETLPKRFKRMGCL